MRAASPATAVCPPGSRRRTWAWWLAVGVYFVVASLAHLEFSLWLVRTRTGPFGAFAWADFVAPAMIACGLALAGWVLAGAWRSRHRWTILAYWALWLVGVALFDRHLIFSVNEYAHYPQYALLAWLIARALDPDRSRVLPGRILFWTTLLGMIDELQQYVWIAPSYGLHLDFNDFLVNLLAAAAGVMLYYGFCPPDGRPLRRSVRAASVEWLTATTIGLAVTVAILSGRIATAPEVPVPPGGIAQLEGGRSVLYVEREPDILGSRATGPHRGEYSILAPGTAFLIMAGVWLVFSTFTSPRSDSNPIGQG